MKDFSENDIVEIILGKDHQILTNVSKAEKELSKLTADIRLDLHGVTDIIDPKRKLLSDDIRKEHTICVISYVGKYSDTRLLARNTIKERIKTGQVDFGILVFKRGKRKSKSRFRYHKPGSKAWVNNLIKSSKPILFVDDSSDHVESVRSMKIENMTAVLFKEEDPDKLVDLLRKFNETTGGYRDKYIKYKKKYLALKEEITLIP